MPLAVIEKNGPNAVDGIASHGYTLAQIVTLPKVRNETVQDAGNRLVSSCNRTGRPSMVKVDVHNSYRSLRRHVKWLLAVGIDVRPSVTHYIWMVPGQIP